MRMGGSILRQLSLKEGWRSTSKNWTRSASEQRYNEGVNERSNWNQMGMMSSEKKRVMVVVDQSSRSKHAMIWALTHLANNGDLLTLLHVISPSDHGSSDAYLASSLASLCKASKPQVEVEALVIHGPKLSTVLSQVKKLEVSVLVLGHKKPSPIINCLFGMSSTEDFVEQCISYAECLTIGVRKQSKGMGGYLISTRWQKNFWLLA